MSFALPPLNLPLDVVSKQLSITTASGIDAAFFNTIRGLSNSTGLFTNPFSDAISSIKSLTSQFQSLAGAAAAVGGTAPLTSMITHMTDMTTIFANVASNIVPVPLPMSTVLAAAVTSASASLPGISPLDTDCIAPFIKSVGVPQLGQILNIAHSQFTLNQLCGTVDPANPIPMLNQFSGMLTGITAGATAFVSNTSSVVTNLLSVPSANLSSALTNGLSSVESSLGSSFASPIASFGGSLFGSIKDQMSTGLASSMRHMTETNFAMKFMITGKDSISGGSFGGILGSGVSSTIANFPSVVNLGHIIP